MTGFLCDFKPVIFDSLKKRKKSPCSILRRLHKHLIGFKCHQKKESKKGRGEGGTEYAREEIEGGEIEGGMQGKGDVE